MKKPHMKEYAILGFSSFSASVASVLAKHGANLLVCDRDAQKVSRALEYATSSIQMDISNADALRKLELNNYDIVIIDTGDDIRASSRGVMIAKENGDPFTIVKATAPIDKIMLEKLGADLIVFPEVEAGENLGYSLFNTDVVTMLRKIPNFNLSAISPEDDWLGKTVSQIRVRKTHGIIIFAIERGNEVIAPIDASDVIFEGDILIVWQKDED
ncbi:MAG: TrkA family potassium uptake protein [Clostridiales bacterium]|jgi:trk system potassium uptake protein TrkA|nr:TrkA family potassium uptake protein [Clostridiales bacterium]